MRAFWPVLLLVPLLGGCVVGDIAKTTLDVATLPVKVVGQGVDSALPNQRRADERRGRELREADERRARADRAFLERCRRNRPLPQDRCPRPGYGH